jgi:hypothetical protein
VDLDAYVLAHHAEWDRLDALSRKRRLDGRESDELVERYQRVATHLSTIRTAAPDATVVVARYGGRERRGDRGDDVVAARPPRRRAEPPLAA